ncbi:MAG TPA: mechanosensitive ion channel family protein [Thermoanaerobaculia bacterium]
MQWKRYILATPSTEALAAAAIVAGGLLLISIIRAVVRRKLRHTHATTKGDIDDLIFDLAGRTKIFLLLFPAIYLGARALDLSRELSRGISLAAELSFVAQVALWIIGFVEFWLQRYRRKRIENDPSALMTVNIFRLGIVVTIWLIAAVVMIDNLGYDVTTLVTGLGIGGVAVALATQNILGDLFASLSIVIDKPFIIGDTIMVDSLSGTVEHIGLKTTRLRAAGGEQLIFSNSDLLKSRIHNFKRMVDRRILFRLGISYETTPEQLERIPAVIRQAIESREKTRFDRAHLLTLGDSALEFEVVYFVTSPDFNVYADIHQAVNLTIVRALAAEGVELAPKVRRNVLC